MENRIYLAIDLKSFYASVECMERGLDPMTTNLVVADESRTEKTICLAVSPSLKSYGIPGRPRLFEVVQKMKEVNAARQRSAPERRFAGSSSEYNELKIRPDLAVDYIVAPPQMARYMEISTEIYNIYLKYIAPEDMHVYLIDEVFMDVTSYLNTYQLSAREFAMKIIIDVLHTAGITATAGIGTNLYLCKVAMDIEAKYIPPDKNGVRIAELDEMSYRRKLWSHRPLTDFWRVGRGYANKLEQNGIFTMGDVARCSVGYDIENLTDLNRRKKYQGEVKTDRYERKIPKHAHGTANLEGYSSSTKQIMAAMLELFDRIVDKNLLIRRLNVTANRVIDEKSMPKPPQYQQMDFFTDYAAEQEKQKAEQAELAREKKIQEAMIDIKKKFGKNAVLKGTNLSEGATGKDRNNQIGGHKA